MRDSEIEDLAAHPLFAGLTPERRDALLRPSLLQRFPAGVELAREGDPADFLHLVLDGQIEVYASHAGRETTVSVLTAGSTFILAAVVTDRPYLKSARSLVPSRVVMMPAQLVRTLAEEDGRFALRLMTELAGAYRSVVKELKNQKLRSVLERLANWLLRAELDQGGRGTVDLVFEKRVLAARLGTSPEVLSRSFAALGAYGVAVRGRTITLSDIPALTRLAKPTPLIDDPDS
jgi:CRP/FNR family transcriptional activator FtrB